MILFGKASLRRALREYVAHFRSERNHQGVGNRLLEPCATGNSTDGPFHCRERLGGMLNFYYREAAWKPGFSFWTIRETSATPALLNAASNARLSPLILNWFKTKG